METSGLKYGFKFVALIAVAFHFLAHDGVAQDKPVEAQRMAQEVDGYRIKIVRGGGGTFGYEIRRGPEVLVRQERNPFTGSELGLKEKNAAMRTASWLVRNVLKREEMLPRNKRTPLRILSSKPIPTSVARQLGIAVD